MNENQTTTTVTTVTKETTGVQVAPTMTLAQPTAGNLASYVGHPIANIEAVVHSHFGSGVVILHPGQGITMDLNMSRTVVHVDDQGLVTSIVQG
jgi:hypothetical protein